MKARGFNWDISGSRSAFLKSGNLVLYFKVQLSGRKIVELNENAAFSQGLKIQDALGYESPFLLGNFQLRIVTAFTSVFNKPL